MTDCQGFESCLTDQERKIIKRLEKFYTMNWPQHKLSCTDPTAKEDNYYQHLISSLTLHASRSRENGEVFNEVNAYDHLSDLYKILGQSAMATHYYEKQLEVAQNLPTAELKQFHTGKANAGLGNFSEALSCFLQVVPLTVDTSLQQMAYLELAAAYQELGQYQEAIEVTNLRLQLTHTPSEQCKIVITLGGFYVSLNTSESADSATEAFQRGLQLAEELKDEYSQISALEGLALASDCKQDKAKTIQHLMAALSLSKGLGNKEAHCRTLDTVGGYYTSWGDFEEAIRYCQEALDLAEQVKLRDLQYSLCEKIGKIHFVTDKLQLAKPFLKKAINIAQEMHKPNLYQLQTILDICKISAKFSQWAIPT